ncbi:MAG: hypothetical protein JXR78_09150, partial [Victivallales bacterium]|nr:hypothetical protein [Victivallales bacterium]
IKVITGRPRNGKSYFVVKRIIYDLENTNCHIYTNIEINPVRIAYYVAKRRAEKEHKIFYESLVIPILERMHIFRAFSCLSDLKEFYKINRLWCRHHKARNREHDYNENLSGQLLYHYSYLKSFWHYTKANSRHYYDESYMIFSAKTLSGERNDAETKAWRLELMTFALHHGHYGDEIYLVTHRKNYIDQVLRDNAVFMYEVKNSKFQNILPEHYAKKHPFLLGWLRGLRFPVQFFEVYCYDGCDESTHSDYFRLPTIPYLFKCYNSCSKADTLSNKMIPQNIESEDIHKKAYTYITDWFKQAWFSIIMLVMVIWLFFSFLNVLTELPRRISGRKPVQETTINSSESVPASTSPVSPVSPVAASASVPAPEPEIVERENIVSVTPNFIHWADNFYIKRGQIYDGFEVEKITRDFVVFRSVASGKSFNVAIDGARDYKKYPSRRKAEPTGRKAEPAAGQGGRK